MCLSIKKVIVLAVIGVFFFISGLIVQTYASVYGAGTYNIGSYNTGDDTPPTTPGTPVTQSEISDSTPTWTWTESTDSGEGLETNAYTVSWCNNVQFTNCSSNTSSVASNQFTHSIALSDGIWYFRVKATDRAGNSSSYSQNGNISISTTSSASNSTSSDQTVSNTSISTLSCTDEPPSSAPFLFQMNITDTTAKLFFTPVSNTESFYISFSSKPIAEEHGSIYEATSIGVQSAIISHLMPKTTYYVKVRGQRGCMPGPWSNIMKISTRGKGIRLPQIVYNSTRSKIIPSTSFLKTTKVPNATPITTYDIQKPDQSSTSKTSNSSPSPEFKKSPFFWGSRCILWWCF